MHQILDAIESSEATAADFANLPLPDAYRAAYVRKDEVDMFEGQTSKEKDPRRSLHVDEVAMPELGPGEALVAVMASAINYNTVWTSIFEPMSDLRLPRALRADVAAGRRATTCPTTSWAPTCPASCCATGRGVSTPGSPATASSPTASRSSSSTPTATTTRCSTPSSGSGASRPTSAAWPTSRWSRPTS